MATSQEFLQIAEADDILDIISSDDLVVNSEADVFTAIESWIQFDPAIRKCLFPELMLRLRFMQLTLTFLETLAENPLVQWQGGEESRVAEVIRTAVEYKRGGELRLQKDGASRFAEVLTDTLRRPPSMLCVVGGKNSQYTTQDSVDLYDTLTNRWQHLPRMRTSRFECGAAFLDGHLYVMGSLRLDADATFSHHHDVTVTYWSRDATGGDTWRDAPSMEQPRSALCVVVLGGYLYTMGGFTGQSYLSTVERYQPGGVWEQRANLLQARSCFCAVSLEGAVYALGGYGPPCLNSMERYDPEQDLWTSVAHMHEKRINFGAGSVCGFLFAVGGHNGVAYLSSCERYDPFTDQWTTVSGMGQPRKGLGVAVIGKHLYAVGGHSGALYLNTMIRYDPHTDTWREMEELDSGRSSFACCAL